MSHEDKEPPERPWYADDDMADDEDLHGREESLLDCGMMPDRICNFIGTEYCDWECPLDSLRRKAE